MIKYSTRGRVEWQIQYEVNIIYDPFTDLLVLRGRINKTWNKSFNTYGYIEDG